MTVNVRAVRGRRKLRFASFDDVLADAEAVVAWPSVQMLGNWSLSQLLVHVSLAIHGSIDGIPGRAAPRAARMFGPAIRHIVMRRGIPPGYNLGKKMEPLAFPAGLSNLESLGRLRLATERSKVEPMIAPHPLFGRMTHTQWLLIHLRHAELHLSFASLGVARGPDE